MVIVSPGLGAAEVEMGIEVHDGERPEPPSERAKRRQRDRMIAADQDGRGRQRTDLGLDRASHPRAIEWRKHDVARVDAA